VHYVGSDPSYRPEDDWTRLLICTEPDCESGCTKTEGGFEVKGMLVHRAHLLHLAQAGMADLDSITTTQLAALYVLLGITAWPLDNQEVNSALLSHPDVRIYLTSQDVDSEEGSEQSR
jgi:hypothetical protein